MRAGKRNIFMTIVIFAGCEVRKMAEGVKLLLIVTDASVFQDGFPNALLQVILAEFVAHHLMDGVDG